ncbi:AAA family ATPase [Clostridium perfringens]|uniref:ATP-dependent nuclease n=1 Tax=Clostridium perfringens TaxID=1502 RepID=UPI0030D2027C
MTYPISTTITLPEVFLDKSINLTFYSGLTVFVGPNGSGKTQVMRKLKYDLQSKINGKYVRYLSSNRIGTLEQYRSKTEQYDYNIGKSSLGGLELKKMRHQLEIASGDFFTLDERKDVYIKVEERLSKLFNRSVFLQWDNGQLNVYFKRNNFSKEYSISSESSGLLNLISILAALYDDEVKVLLIDEPEVSLHPQLQSFLLSEIKKVAGDYEDENKKMIIMATHSTDMIEISNTEDLTKYIFFLNDGKSPVQIKPESDELKNKKLKDLVARMGQVHKRAFFIEKPLLVEGISDSLMCNYFNDKFDLNLGVAGAHIVPVDGKGEFASMVKLMKLIGKKPIVIADLDAFVDNNDIVSIFINDEKVKIKASELGHFDAKNFINSVKNSFNKVCKEDGEKIRDKFQQHAYWKNRQGNDEIAKRRAIMAILMQNDNNIISNWECGEKWVAIKKTIGTLFDCLEQGGCFILRKGEIESYYIFSDKETSIGKPSAAMDEIEVLDSKTNQFIEEHYSDVLRALRYSAKFKQIDETEQIKLEILSEIAPILSVLEVDTTSDDINTIIRKARGNNKSLFKYTTRLIDDVLTINIDLNSKIIDVSGFPFTIKKGDNVNSVVDNIIKKI